MTHFVIVTGAGASSSLGPEARPIPLMVGWSDLVREELDRSDKGLAAAIGLHPGQTSEEFEEIVGAYLNYQNQMDLFERFVLIGGQPIGSMNGEVQQWLSRTKNRAAQFSRIMQETLYNTFGADSVDDERAASTYEMLIETLMPDGLNNKSSLVIATTNYDRQSRLRLAG
jgi:hypothetical protein